MGKALIIKGADFSQVAVDTIDIVVGQPTISIDLFGNVTISSPNGEDIYYTTDGSTPTNQSTKYTAGFVVQTNTTVKAVCYLGGNYSEVTSKLYDGTLQAPNINITPKGVVTITATDNVSIRYTVDGQTDPTTSTGTVYSAPFTVEDGVEVRAIAFITSGSTTISSSIATNTAVVPEGIMAGKKFNSPIVGQLVSYTDDSERFVSPKISIAPKSTVTWDNINGEYQVDYLVELSANGIVTQYWNTKNLKSRTVTLKDENTAFIRISNKMGAQYAGVKIIQDNAILWAYDGSTE